MSDSASERRRFHRIAFDAGTRLYPLIGGIDQGFIEGVDNLFFRDGHTNSTESGLIHIYNNFLPR